VKTEGWSTSTGTSRTISPVPLRVDPAKAALNGVSTEQVAETVRLAVDGTGAGLLHRAGEKEDVSIVLRLPQAERSRLDSLRAVRVMGRQGNLVPLGELVRIVSETAEKSIYHKNLMPVVYVTADVAGKVEAPCTPSCRSTRNSTS